MSNFSLNNARTKIDDADQRLCEIFAYATLDENGAQEVEINNAIETTLKVASVELYIAMAKFINFSSMADLEKRIIQIALAGSISLRADGIAEVGIVKKAEGAKDSFVPDRHQSVIDNKVLQVYTLSGDCIKGRIAGIAFNAMMTISVKDQNDYLNNRLSALDPVIAKLKAPVIRSELKQA